MLATFRLLIVTMASCVVAVAHAQGDPAAPSPSAPMHSDDDAIRLSQPTPASPEPPLHYGIPPAPQGVYPAAPPSEGLALEEEPGLRIDGMRLGSGDATRLRVLSADLTALAARGGSSVADGIISIVTGGLLIALGVLLDVNYDDSSSVFLYVFGGANVARGIIDLALVPDPYEPALRYTHLPMRNVTEVRSRLAFGEQALESLADRNRTARLLSGSVSVLSGVAIVPLYLAPNDFEIRSALDVFFLVGAGLAVITGVITLLTRTDAERRWQAYSELRERLRQDETPTSVQPGPRALSSGMERGQVAPDLRMQLGVRF